MEALFHIDTSMIRTKSCGQFKIYYKIKQPSAFHTIQLKHLQILIGLCQNFSEISLLFLRKTVMETNVTKSEMWLLHFAKKTNKKKLHFASNKHLLLNKKQMSFVRFYNMLHSSVETPAGRNCALLKLKSIAIANSLTLIEKYPIYLVKDCHGNTAGDGAEVIFNM